MFSEGYAEMTASISLANAVLIKCVGGVQHIGTGGYGSVYRGIWKGLEVAIKTVVFQDRDEDGTAERVFKEAAIACNMSHEHIVNSFTNELKRMPSQLPNELVDYKLYIIQVRTAVTCACMLHHAQLWLLLSSARHP